MAETQLILSTVVKGTETATKALNDVKGSLDGIGDAAKTGTKTMSTFSDKLKANREGFVALGVAAGAATYAITTGIKGAIKEATNFQNAMTGLQSIAEGTGKDFEKAKVFLQDFTKDGLISTSDAATSLKSLFQRGFSLEQSIELLNRFKDAASFGRQSTLGLGEAVRGAAEGLKNENSMLVDNAGITKNVAKMWEDYAQKIGVKTNALTLDQKREAEYQGVLEESKFQVGDATKYAEGYAGAVARQEAASLKLQQTIGTALMPAMTQLTQAVTSIIEPVSKWTQEHPELTSNIILATTAIAGLTTVITAFGFVIPSIIAGVKAIGIIIGALTGPIGLAIASITALVTAGWYLYDNWDQVKTNIVLVWDQLQKDIKMITGAIIEYVVGGFDKMMKKIDEAINYLAEKARQAKEYVSQVLSSAGTSYTSGFLSKPGQALGNMIYGAYANGGSVSGGKPILVGEKGPEIFTPNSAGQIIPNHKIGGSGSNIVINITGTFGSDAIGEISDAIVTNLKRASYI